MRYFQNDDTFGTNNIHSARGSRGPRHANGADRIESAAFPTPPSDAPLNPWAHELPVVDSPGSIIATVPGTLGYYPQESAVILGLVRDEGDPGGVFLGPVLRADITRTADFAEFIASATLESCCAFFAVIVTRMPDSQAAEQAAKDLERLADGGGQPLIDACWAVSEIAHGTPYTTVFGPDQDGYAQAGIDPCWHSGVVGSVVSSPAMQSLRANGALPALNRRDIFAYFDPGQSGENEADHPRDFPVIEITSRAHRKAEALRMKIDRCEPGAGEVVRAACQALRDAPAHPLVGEDKKLQLGQVFCEESGIEALATVLSRNVLRDCIIGEAVRFPETAGTALLAVARNFPGVIRANALSVWALIAISRGLSSWASAALLTAQEEIPMHSMSAICLEVLAHGEQQHLVTTVLTGCELECEHILAEEDGLM